MQALVALALSASFASAFDVLNVCETNMPWYNIGQIIAYNLDECASLSAANSSLSFNFSSTTDVFSIFNTSSECERNGLPLKSTLVTSNCTEVMPPNSQYHLKIAITQRICFPKRCMAADPCLSLSGNSTRCGLDALCGWDSHLNFCRNRCFTISNISECAANDQCDTDGADCMRDILAAVGTSLAISGSVLVVLVLSACLLCCCCVVLIACACRPRHHRTRVEFNTVPVGYYGAVPTKQV